MKALVKTASGYDQMELREIDEPEVYGDRVKIKVAYTGICGSDIHTFKGEYNNANTPVVLGHEFSGEVVAVGPDVKSIKVGDRVTSETTFQTCGTCPYCLKKDYNLCGNRKGIGTQINGSMAEFVLSREESCHVLHDNISYKSAALTEPLACCVHAALEKTTISPTDIVLIFGPGPIGLLLAQVVKSQGATVIMAGITRDLPRLELAVELGVDRIIDLQKEDLTSLVLSMTNNIGVDRIFDCSGVISAVNQGLPLIRKKGDFVQVGLFAKKTNELDEESIIQREINYIGSRSQKPSSWITSLDLLTKHKINTEKMITKIFDLCDWRTAFDKVMEGTEIKVLIKS